MWLLLCVLFLFLTIQGQPSPSCDSQACTIIDHTTPGAILNAGFTKKHEAIPDWALTFLATVFYTYLDSDKDGSVDDPNIFNALRSASCHGIALSETNDVFPTGELKDSFCGISRTYGETNFDLTNDFA